MYFKCSALTNVTFLVCVDFSENNSPGLFLNILKTYSAMTLEIICNFSDQWSRADLWLNHRLLSAVIRQNCNDLHQNISSSLMNSQCNIQYWNTNTEVDLKALKVELVLITTTLIKSFYWITSWVIMILAKYNWSVILVLLVQSKLLQGYVINEN